MYVWRETPIKRKKENINGKVWKLYWLIIGGNFGDQAQATNISKTAEGFMFFTKLLCYYFIAHNENRYY